MLEMVDTERYFVNQFPGYDGRTLLDENGFLTERVSKKIKAFIGCKRKELNAAIQNDQLNLKDASVYTGIAGIAILYLQFPAGQPKGKELCCELLELSRKHSKTEKIAFLCGSSGPLAVSAASLSENDKEKSEYMEDLMQKSKCLKDKCHTDEVLNGRAGYLFSLLYVQVVAKLPVDIGLIKAAVKSIFESGLSTSSSSHSMPLNYTWHNKQYIGAAHGYVGILYMLLQAKMLYPNSIGEQQLMLVEQCLDKLIEFKYPSNNIMSSIGNERDRLVQWCHGAPGAIHLYVLAYKLYKNGRYLLMARQFAEVIWTRGLLRKSFGLCHGVSGNGYGLLAMYQLTKEKEYLWKAVKFAEWCVDCNAFDCPVPDRPLSLYEGMAGMLYFLCDILDPTNAKYPAFQIVDY